MQNYKKGCQNIQNTRGCCVNTTDVQHFAPMASCEQCVDRYAVFVKEKNPMYGCCVQCMTLVLDFISDVQHCYAASAICGLCLTHSIHASRQLTQRCKQGVG